MKKINLILALFILAVIAVQCEKYVNPFSVTHEWETYTIFPEGYDCKFDECWFTPDGHKANPFYIHAIKDTAFMFDFQFPDSSCIYDIGKDQSDWNKLYGIVDYLNNTHTESYRFAWRWLNDELQIGYYVHIDNAIYKGIMYVADIREVVTGVIEVTDNFVTFKIISDLTLEKTIYDDRIRCIEKGFTSNPYFGGDCAVNHIVRWNIRTKCIITALDNNKY